VTPWICTVAAIAAVACGGPAIGDAKDGAAVFQAMCATCHGADGRPPSSMVARIGVRDLTDAEFRARVTPDMVEQQVRAGSRTKLMPSFEGVLSEPQIAAVAAFVASPRFPLPPAAPR
jgi:mono/diheme cytochrome c family protein